MNILIVENSPRMRRTIRSLLAGLAHEVFECEDGSQVLAAYQAHRPDWVLMDIKLKEVDGIVVTRALLAAFPGSEGGNRHRIRRRAVTASGAAGRSLRLRA